MKIRRIVTKKSKISSPAFKRYESQRRIARFVFLYPAEIKPSARGELEITTLNEMYLQEGKLDVQLLGRGYAWLDTGTMDSLVEAADFVRMIEQRQGIKISAPEEIAYKYGWINRGKLLESAERYGKSPYGQHLRNVADDRLKY